MATHHEQSSLDVEAMVVELEQKLDRLKILYEQYFMGIEKREPLVTLKDVVRVMRALEQVQIRNTGLRYRYRNLVQRLNSYRSYWHRTIRAIENGTYFRDVARMGRNMARKGISVAMPTTGRMKSAAEVERAITEAVRDPSSDLPEISGGQAGAVSSEKRDKWLASDTVETPLPPADLAGARPAPARVAPEDPALAPIDLDDFSEESPTSADLPRPGSVDSVLPAPPLVAVPSRRPEPAPPGRAAAPPSPTPAVPAAPSPRAAAGIPPPLPPRDTSPGRPPLVPRSTGPGTPPAPPRAVSPAVPPPLPPRITSPGGGRPRPPPTPPVQAGVAPSAGRPSSPAPAGMSEPELQSLYRRFVRAKEMCGEDTSSVHYDSLVKSISQQLPKIREQNRGRNVEFQVVIREGRAILRATLK